MRSNAFTVFQNSHPHMFDQVTILCDGSGTIDQPKNKPVRDTLQKLSDTTSTNIILTTSSVETEALEYLTLLKEGGYNFCSTIISFDTFFCHKDWPSFYEKLFKMGLDPQKTMLVDDDKKNLENAERYGLTAISSQNSEDAAVMIQQNFYSMVSDRALFPNGLSSITKFDPSL